MTVQQPIQIIDGQTVTAVRHWTDTLFSFRVTRPRSLRFRSGEFVMIGLPGETGKPILRAYSIASPNWDEELEFYSIKVPDGPLTSKLQKIEIGDQIILRPKPVGTLVLDALLPGKVLWMMATGTGIAPFASLIRDPETYERYDRVILAHTCRTQAELAYGSDLVEAFSEDPLVGEYAEALSYYPSTTRDDFLRKGRNSDHVRSGKIFEATGTEPWHADRDRVMICGSLALNEDMAALCEDAGLREGSNSDPAHYVVEKAFVG